MKTVISASRRTDLVAFFPAWLAGALRQGAASVHGPSGRTRHVDVDLASVHTLVLWSKDFSNLISDRHGLRRLAKRYPLYFLFTVTGLGGTPAEPDASEPGAALAQLPELVALAGTARRVSLRFDPVVFWDDGGTPRSNLAFFVTAAEHAARAGVEDVRISFAQWYRKAVRRARVRGFEFTDPDESKKIEAAAWLAEVAARREIRLLSCSQVFLTRVPGIQASSCIDGRLLRALHPRGEDASVKKDRSQRPECGCTESVDIGSYAQTCPHGCVYCYANPKG